MLQQIHQDHNNINRLLEALRQMIAAARNEQPIRYALVRDIVDYLAGYAEAQHHPKEDLIYDYYLRYRVVADTVANRLQADHERLEKQTAEVVELLEMIMHDAVIPTDTILAKLTEFVDAQQRHLDYEEREILPRIRDSFTADDWMNLQQQWKNGHCEDPLFGRQIQDRYTELAQYLTEAELA